MFVFFFLIKIKHFIFKWCIVQKPSFDLSGEQLKIQLQRSHDLLKSELIATNSNQRLTAMFLNEFYYAVSLRLFISKSVINLVFV